MTEKYEICYADELPVGKRKIVEIKGRSIGIFNVNNNFYAVRNRCPHKGAPLCRGMVKGFVSSPDVYEFEITREGEILRCPWHGWEFDVTTGESVFNPHKVRVKRYEVSVEEEASSALYDFADDPDDDDPSIETYQVSLENRDSSGRPKLFVHLR